MTYQCPRHHSGSIGEKMIADETAVLLIHTQVSLVSSRWLYAQDKLKFQSEALSSSLK